VRAAISALLTTALVVTGVITAVVFAVPDLVTVGLFLLILPGLILAFTPTVFLYLAVFAIPWFLLNRRGVAIGVLGGLAAVAGVGVGLPVMWNGYTDQRLQEAMAKEEPPSAEIGSANIVALQPGRSVLKTGCGDLCQSLLYDSGVQRVVLFPAQKTGYVSFHIQNENNCPDASPQLLTTDFRSQWLTSEERQRIARSTRLRIAGGECLVRDENWNGSPDWVLERVKEDFGTAVKPLSLLPGEVHAEGLQLMAHGEVISRQTRLQARKLFVPLNLSPRSGSELSLRGWEWTRTRDFQPPVDTRAFLERSTAANVAPAIARSEPSKIRKTLDTALDNPSESGTAFALVDDYYNLFTFPIRQKAQPEDARRMAKLIADHRVTAFWHLPIQAIPFDSDRLLLRDPILNRLPHLAEEEKWESYRALASLTDRLPERAFEHPDPRVDVLLADPDRRRAAPALVRRLSDRGPSAADRLVEIMIEGWKKPSSKRRAGNQGEDSLAAIMGLCRIGDQARSVLPKLRQAAADGNVPPGTQESDLWRATLIALGANPAEFALPRNRSGLLGPYRARLERQAREKCK
jgi:hypothetical protein